MSNWLSANEWVFGMMGGILLFFLGNAAKSYWDKQKNQDDDIRSLGTKIDETNLHLVEIKYTLKDKPDVEQVEQIVDYKIETHREGCPGHKPIIAEARG
jgi:hypothetical protein